jgi:hypothetical protein
MPDTAPLVALRGDRPAVAAGSDKESNVVDVEFAGTVTLGLYSPDTVLTGANTDSRTIVLVNKGQAGAGTTIVATKAFTSGVNARPTTRRRSPCRPRPRTSSSPPATSWRGSRTTSARPASPTRAVWSSSRSPAADVRPSALHRRHQGAPIRSWWGAAPSRPSATRSTSRRRARPRTCGSTSPPSRPADAGPELHPEPRRRGPARPHRRDAILPAGRHRRGRCRRRGPGPEPRTAQRQHHRRRRQRARRLPR